MLIAGIQVMNAFTLTDRQVFPGTTITKLDETGQTTKAQITYCGQDQM